MSIDTKPTEAEREAALLNLIAEFGWDAELRRGYDGLEIAFDGDMHKIQLTQLNRIAEVAASSGIVVNVGSWASGSLSIEIRTRPNFDFSLEIEELRRQGLYEDGDAIDVDLCTGGYLFEVRRGVRAVTFVVPEEVISRGEAPLVFLRLREAFVRLGASP
jgi:hypothetical protein